MTLLFWLLVGHAIADYPLQGDFLSKAKNRHTSIPGIPWWHAMFWHALMHGGAVAYLTGSLALGIAETVIHYGIDIAKCEGKTDFNRDQLLHIACKAAWVLALANG